MSSPETQDSPVPEVTEVPEGAIFLPTDSLTTREIDKQLSEMLFGRGELGGLEPQAKAELAARLYAQKAQLAELALRAS